VITKASKSNYALGCSWVILTMLDNRRIDPSPLPVTALSQMEFLDSPFFNFPGPNQHLPASVLGSINRENLQDYVFQSRPKVSPFTGIKLFHEWLSWLPREFASARIGIVHPSALLEFTVHQTLGTMKHPLYHPWRYYRCYISV
jgi:hypothetical protein